MYQKDTSLTIFSNPALTLLKTRFRNDSTVIQILLLAITEKLP
jgi:hypothetical protein